MANRNKGRRGRSRKRRASGGRPPDAAAAVQPRREPAARRRSETSAKPDGGYRVPGSVGARPRAPWHPLPLAELLILIGLIAVAIGAARGEAGKSILFVGIGAVLIGTLDTTIREHLSGYRSHAGLLAAMPTALVHGGVALALYALGAPSPAWVIVPLVLDVPLFSVLLKLLRARFEDARRERVFAGGRRR